MFGNILGFDNIQIDGWEQIVTGEIAKVSIPDCSYISPYTFNYCTNLTGAYFDNCSMIGSRAFAFCSSLTSISFPACVTISAYAFYSCSSLKSIYFPVCTNVDTYAFYGCFDLSTISFPLCSIINGNAFAQCSNLTVISFPECVSIDNYAFISCINLTSLYLLASTICSLGGSSVFYSTPIGGYSESAGRLGYVYVPASLYASYKEASYWSDISSAIMSV